jgi:hypothetical protein
VLLFALEVARREPAVKRLALYEAPFIVDDSRPPIPRGYATNLARFVAEDRRGDAVKLFLRQVGAPATFVGLMPLLPVWAKLKAVAHTLPYDAAIVGEYQTGEPLPAARWAFLKMSSLVVDGGKSPAWFHAGAQALADALLNAELRVLEGQTHNVKAKALAPLPRKFFRDEATAAEQSGESIASGSRS